MARRYQPKSGGTVQEAAQRLFDAGVHPAQDALEAQDESVKLSNALCRVEAEKRDLLKALMDMVFLFELRASGTADEEVVANAKSEIRKARGES